MTDNEIRLRFEAVGKLLEQKPDFKKFLDSKEFREAAMADTDIAHNILRGKTFILTGDLRSIHIGEFGSMSMLVTIGNTFDGINKSTEVCVEVPDNLYADVLSMKPDTGVVFEVKYKKFNVVVDTFELLGVQDYNKPLNFPYCVCMGDNPDPNAYADMCYRILGYAEADYSDHCPLCGSKTRKVRDVYTEKFQNRVKFSRRGI